MAEALCRGILDAGVCTESQIIVSDPDSQRRKCMSKLLGAGNVRATNEDVCRGVETIVLAVKPQAASAVFAGLKGAIPKGSLVISIVTGVKLAQLAAETGTDRVVRVMPNTPALVGVGASGYSPGPGVTEADFKTVKSVLGAVGLCMELPEHLLDAVTGLSGSGPAFIYAVIEAMSDAGVYLGLSRRDSTALAAQTVKGAAEMVLQCGEHPGQLKDRVTTPGGTTIEGLLALERSGLRAAIMNAVIAAGEKAARLSSK